MGIFGIAAPLSFTPSSCCSSNNTCAICLIHLIFFLEHVPIKCGSWNMQSPPVGFVFSTLHALFALTALSCTHGRIWRDECVLLNPSIFCKPDRWPWIDDGLGQR